MAIIDKIQLSGTVYTIGNETTTAVTSASTDNEIPTAKAVYDAIPQGGGGKAIEAGRGISITTGETADTVSLNLPISAGTGTDSIIIGANHTDNSWKPIASGKYSIASGIACKARGDNSLAFGYYNDVYGTNDVAIGYMNKIENNRNQDAFAFGLSNTITSNDYVGISARAAAVGGYKNIVKSFVEFGVGNSNNTSYSSNTFGDSGNTLFSVGNGDGNPNVNQTTIHRHNAFEIRQNGDIYIADTNDTSTTNYYEKPMIKLQDALGGGGSSYTAGDGIDINNDVISVTGKVDTTTYETYTAATDTALASKQTTLTAGTGISIVDNVISATGGGESCTVDSTTMFYTFNDRYSNDALDMRVKYVVLDYDQDRTEIPNVSIDVNFRDVNYNTYVNQNINLDYSTSSYTLGDISQAEYIDVTYDSTIDDFKISVATAYTSTVFVGTINFWNKKIKVPFYTISSGSPCTAIENDIPTAISELGNNMLKGLKEVIISSQKDAIYTYYNTIGGNDGQRKIKLDEIDGSNFTLKPDIYVGLGRSGWTEINLSDQCNIGSLKSTKYRVTYNDSELDSYSMGLQLTVEYAGNEMNDYVAFDETKQPSLQTQDVFSAATLDWNASTKELVITYPETIELYGKQESVNIGQIYSNGCNFGNAITKLESYGEEKQALKPYVKETRAALGGLKLVKLTQSEYDALSPNYDANTLYVING